MVLSDADHKDSKSTTGPVKQRLRWPLALCILLIGAANSVLILVSAPASGKADAGLGRFGHSDRRTGGNTEPTCQPERYTAAGVRGEVVLGVPNVDGAASKRRKCVALRDGGFWRSTGAAVPLTPGPVPPQVALPESLGLRGVGHARPIQGSEIVRQPRN